MVLSLLTVFSTQDIIPVIITRDRKSENRNRGIRSTLIIQYMREDKSNAFDFHF